MQSLPRAGWLLVLAMAAVILGGASLARAWLLAGVRDRLAQKYQQRLASLSERQAALFVRRLAHSEGEWLDVLVAASADERPAVAAAAEVELCEMVDRWAELAEESSSYVADLARLLAQQAPGLPPQRRHLAHSLAQRLLDWPIDGRLVDAAELIADCQSVLLLPRAEPAEIRVAAAAAPPSIQSQPEPPPAAAPVLPPPPAPAPIVEARPAPPSAVMPQPQ